MTPKTHTWPSGWTKELPGSLPGPSGWRKRPGRIMCSCSSHPHAHLHAQLGRISASAAPSAAIDHRRRRARPHALEELVVRPPVSGGGSPDASIRLAGAFAPAPALSPSAPSSSFLVPALAALVLALLAPFALLGLARAVYAVYAISSLDTGVPLRPPHKELLDVYTNCAIQ